MMAITTKSSTSVNPRRFLTFIVYLPFDVWHPRARPLVAAFQKAELQYKLAQILVLGQVGQAFADQVREASALPVHTYDERLTSALSSRRMHERGESARSRKGRVDQGAAVALLESWLMRLDADRRRKAEA